MSGSIFLSPSQTRLVTIIAHVDHGKTTLADNLIENNGLISERLAGTLRYLDFDPEEQRRGITMHASAIGLKHLYQGNNNHKKNPASATANHNKSTPMIVHLVDSPGHADFSVEVSSALLACDGALLVVDAVEGMGARTHQVLREAFLHELVPVLVINKIDRLCCDLCLTATEAYLRLRALIENVNAAASSMLTSAKHGKEISQQEEEAWAFDPARGNVIFASALYGWGFTLQSLARSLFRRKEVSIKPMLLKQYLFGDFKIKDEKVLKWKQGSEQVPLFAQYALQPIWDLYESVAGAASAAGLGSILFADDQAWTLCYKIFNRERPETTCRQTKMNLRQS
jgi:ribosome assembly protein 1